MRDLTKALLLVAALAAFLAACGGTAVPRPIQLNDVWGGVMNHAGSDFLAFAIDVETEVDGSVGTISGVGVASDGDGHIYLTVTGSSRPNEVKLTMTDLYGDAIRFDGSQEGDVIRGTWSYATLAMSGSFRMAEEENVDLLAARTAAVGFAELAR